MRTFIAIAPSQAVRNYLAHYSYELQQMSGGRSWVSPENYHITIRFLGDVEQVGKIYAAMDKIASEFEPFDLAVTGIRTLARSKNAMLLAQVDDIQAQLKFLYKELEQALYNVGFEKEKREYKPHITLARALSLNDVVRFVSDWDYGLRWKVDEITFYESERVNQHMQYIPLHTSKLGVKRQRR